ncbi:MAG: trigger factor, partial [Bacteroidales bacterium]|nr:trigger factor [Bacteroidales bacterium]
MNILRENIEHLNDVITIEIDETDYHEQVEKSLKDLKRKANIPGFRPGHVPMGMISKMYKKSIVADEISKMINDNLLNYIKENDINILFEPLALPDKTKGDFEKEEENFSFSFEIGIHPDFEVSYEKTKKINYLKINASEKEIEEEIKKLQHKMGKFSSTEEVVAEDMLLVTVLTEGDNKEEFTASLLLSYIKDKKQKEFIGKKIHDVIQINTTEIFKSDYERSTFLKTKVDDLVNAPVNISIKIDAIHHIEPAELNADFFEKAFPDSDVKDLKSLKESIKKQIELSYERDEKMLYRNKIMNELIEQTTFELPDNFIKRFLVVNKSEEYTKENIDEKYIDIK